MAGRIEIIRQRRFRSNWTGAHFALLSLLQLASPLPASAQTVDSALRGHGGPIRAMALLSDGHTLVTGSFDSTIIVWDLANGSARRVLRFHNSAVTSLVALGQGCFASGGEDARIALWCGDATVPDRVLEGHQGPVTALSGNLASGSWDRQVRIWSTSASTIETETVVTEHQAPVNGVGWLPASGNLVSIAYDGEIRITALAVKGQTPRQLHRLQLPVALNGLAIAPDGRIVLTGADGTVRILGSNLAPHSQIALPDGPLTAMAITPDGRTAAVAGLRTPVTLIDLASGQVLNRILGPGLPIWALAFSSDGSELYTGGADRALRRWTVATGAPAGPALSPAANTLSVSAIEPGAKVFRACQACHALTAADDHRAGPSLYGIMGRRIATAPDYAYSEALRGMSIVWSPETIARLFEVGPAAMTPGTKMPEQRISDPADRRALVEWLSRVTRH